MFGNIPVEMEFTKSDEIILSDEYIESARNMSYSERKGLEIMYDFFDILTKSVYNPRYMKDNTQRLESMYYTLRTMIDVDLDTSDGWVGDGARTYIRISDDYYRGYRVTDDVSDLVNSLDALREGIHYDPMLRQRILDYPHRGGMITPMNHVLHLVFALQNRAIDVESAKQLISTVLDAGDDRT